jgi:hypothetical protein
MGQALDSKKPMKTQNPGKSGPIGVVEETFNI